MDGPRFVIEASEASSMATHSGLSLLQLLPTFAKSAQTLVRPSISNYHVGAVGLGSDGRIFVGVNLEFPGLPLHHSVHAEQFLVTNLVVHGNPHLLALAVSAAPCGHCRQFLQELRHASDLQIFITSDEQGQHKPSNFKPLSSFLPPLKCPMAGTFYRSPAPGEPPLVKVPARFLARGGFVWLVRLILGLLKWSS
ncbi:hypothetical protein CsSME_00046718 [Camellia sinensis var. sinensis]